VLEITAASLDSPWETTTSLMHRSCNDGGTQLSPLSFYAVPEAVEISHACFVHLVLQYFLHFSQLDLNPANLEATVEAEWILAFLFLQKRHFQWRHNYVSITWCRSSIDGTFYNFSVTRTVRMIHAKNCEKLSKFVEVTAKILSVLFSGHGVLMSFLFFVSYPMFVLI